MCIPHDWAYLFCYEILCYYTGKLFDGDTTINKEQGFLLFKDMIQSKIEQHLLTNQPKATMNELCQFIVQSMIKDLESPYVLSGA